MAYSICKSKIYTDLCTLKNWRKYLGAPVECNGFLKLIYLVNKDIKQSTMMWLFQVRAWKESQCFSTECFLWQGCLTFWQVFFEQYNKYNIQAVAASVLCACVTSERIFKPDFWMSKCLLTERWFPLPAPHFSLTDQSSQLIHSWLQLVAVPMSGCFYLSFAGVSRSCTACGEGGSYHLLKNSHFGAQREGV